MSYQNRFLNLGLIVAAAKSPDGFPSFEKFMSNSCAYTYLDSESYPIHRMFVEYPAIRKDLWLIIGTQELKGGRPSKGLSALCKSWLVLQNSANKSSHEDSIQIYLDLVEKTEEKYKGILSEITQVLRKRIQEGSGDAEII